MNHPLSVEQAKANLRTWAAEADAPSGALTIERLLATVTVAGVIARALAPRGPGARLFSLSTMVRTGALCLPLVVRALERNKARQAPISAPH